MQTNPIPSTPSGALPPAHAQNDLDRYTAAFLHWESGYRLNPADFLTTEEVAALDALDISTQRAAWFIGCLRAAEDTAQVSA